MAHKNLKQQWLKIAGLTLAIFSFATFANAQSTADQTKQPTAVRLIDNKGTIKYLQVVNGLTQVTNTTSDKTTTTWQLGGTLTTNTYIAASSGKEFALDGLALVNYSTAAASATDRSNHDGGTGAGWTVLVRDENTGAIEKVVLSNLLQVNGGEIVVAATTDGTAPTLADASIPADYKKVSVYRNGAKLIANVDYAVTSGSVSLNTAATPVTGAAPSDWAIYAGDVFEVQWVK